MIETTVEDRAFPACLTEIAHATFAFGDDEGVDFESYDDFLSAAETTDWLRHWTGNHDLDGAAFRVFGQDGTGGLAVILCVRPGRGLAEQPVAFMGSEGERGVLAANLSDFLWVLADGFGPKEAVLYQERAAQPDDALLGIAERHASTPRRTARQIIGEAQAEFATFSDEVDALCG